MKSETKKPRNVLSRTKKSEKVKAREVRQEKTQGMRKQGWCKDAFSLLKIKTHPKVESRISENKIILPPF